MALSGAPGPAAPPPADDASPVGPDGRGRSSAYLDGAPPGHTGGFGEPSCHRCHFDRPVNSEGGELSVRGVPESYRRGEVYRLEVRVSGEMLERGGFQLSARCAAGDRKGRQAGLLETPGDRAEVVEGTGEKYRGSEGVQYARHTEAGTRPRPDSGRTVSWSVRWRAPGASGRDGNAGPPCGGVILHVAANVGNGDDSEFGDRIHLDAMSVGVAGP